MIRWILTNSKQAFRPSCSALIQSVCLLLLFLAGSVNCVRAAGLQICPRHPYYFRHGDRHIVLLGVSDRALFSIWQNDKGLSWKTYLDDLKANHLNYVRQDLCEWGKLRVPIRYPAQFSNPAWAFARTGPGTAVDARPKFDLTKFDQSYFDNRIKPFLRRAQEYGIYVELTLFEGFRSTRDFEQSLYAPANNINRLGLAPRGVTSDSALDNRRLIAIQQAYVDKVLAETAGFENVIYEIANETGAKRWVAHFVDYIHNHPRRPSALVSAGEQTTSFDPRKGANDIVVKHRGNGGNYAVDADAANHHDSLLSFRVGKPVIHNEYFLYANRSTDDVNFPRKIMWADFTAGGHSNFFDFAFWRGSGRTVSEGYPSRTPPPEILGAGRHLLDFLALNNVEFWTMTPHDDLTDVAGKSEPRIFTLARPAHQYISYILGDGPVNVTIRLTQGTFYVRWYDPKSGRFLTAKTQTKGPGPSRLESPPFTDDIVLYISKSAP